MWGPWMFLVTRDVVVTLDVVGLGGCGLGYGSGSGGNAVPLCADGDEQDLCRVVVGSLRAALRAQDVSLHALWCHSGD